MGRNRPLTEQEKQHLREMNSGEKHPMYGKKHTEEAKKKLK